MSGHIPRNARFPRNPAAHLNGACGITEAHSDEDHVPMKLYRVTYYAEYPGRPIEVMTVSAPDVQSARDEAKRLDPRYIATNKTPRKIGERA